jgi:hypothetical protein
VLSENLAVPEVDQTHHLSISREKEITSNLAFLLATSDKSLKVMAICVEEHCNGEGITIRIVSNTGDLSAVVREFVTLAKILEQANLLVQISTTGQVVSPLSEHSHLYFLHVRVVHLIPLPDCLERVLGFVEETSVKASCPEEEDVHQTILQHASFGVFHLSTAAFYPYVMKELPKMMVFPVILRASSFRDDVDKLLSSLGLYLTSVSG